MRQRLAQSWLGLAMLLSGLLASTAQAQDVAYRLMIDAPAGLQSVIEKSIDIARWQDSTRMTLPLLRSTHHKALAQIAAALEAEGYYAAEISGALDEKASPMVARYLVVPGPRSRVADVNIEFTGPLLKAPADEAPTRAALIAGWKLPIGKPFRHADWEAAKQALLQEMISVRYAAATLVESSARVDPGQHAAHLRVVIDSGPPYALGAVTIQGLDHYPEQIVRHLNPLTVGEPYSTAQLLKFQSRLQDTGYFAYTEVTADAAGAEPASVPVTVNVREAKTKTVGLGAGASTNTGLRGLVNYEDRNLLQRGWRLTSHLQLDQKQQTLAADVRLPLNEDGSRDSFGANLQHSDIAKERTDTLGLRARRTWGSERTEHAALVEYTNETKRVSGLAEDRSGALYFGYALTLRRLYDAIYPRAGYLAQLQFGGAPLGVVADRRFLRIYGKLTHYTPVAQRGTLILRGELGAVMSDKRQDIPQTYLFRAGGDQSVRGHAYQSLGVPEGEAIVGGRYLATASAEYMHWLTERWGGAVFVDVGNATDSRRDHSLAHGLGFGVRWKSPVGPLNFDLAHGTLPGGPDGKWRLHFSVGFSF